MIPISITSNSFHNLHAEIHPYVFGIYLPAVTLELHPKQNEDRMSSPNQCYLTLQVQDDQNDFIFVKISPKIQFSMVNCSEEQDTAIPQEEVKKL